MVVPDGVKQAFASSSTTRTPCASVIRRTAALLQLPGPQGVTSWSWVMPITIVAGPKPCTVPVPVLMICNTPRSATRLVTCCVVSTKLAWSRLPSTADAGEAGNAYVPASPNRADVPSFRAKLCLI